MDKLGPIEKQKHNVLFDNSVNEIIGSKTFFETDKEDENKSVSFMANTDISKVINTPIIDDNYNVSLEEL